jgi:hypothetical protein
MLTTAAAAHSFRYVETDIPAELTIADWRVSRPVPRRRLARLFRR